MLDLTITAPDGTTKATLTAETARYRRTLTGERAGGQVTVSRDAWREATVTTSRRDRVTVERGAGTVLDGLFADTDTDGTTVTISVDSPERAGGDAEPTPVVARRVSESDATIVSDVIDAVPAWSAGTIEELSTDVTLSFSLAGRDKQLRDVQEATGGELSFDGFEIDYVGRLGSERTETLSPDSGHVAGGLRVVADEGSQATHVAVIGSLDAPETRVALVAPESDSRDFEGDDDWTSVVRYQSDTWSAEADDAWRRYSQQESVEAGRLADVAGQIASRLESESRTLTVETSIVGLDVQVGDRFSVSYPERGLDRDLRVIEAAHVLDGDGERYEVVLSNRTPVRDTGDRRRRRTLTDLASGYQGFVDRSPGIGAGSWQLVEASNDIVAELPYRYPDDVEDELQVVLDVQGRAWRAPVDDEGHSHDVTIGTTSASNADFEAVERAQQNTTGEALDSFTGVEDTFAPGSVDTSEVRVGASLRPKIERGTRVDSNVDFAYQVYFENTDTGLSQFLGNYRFTINGDSDPVGSVDVINREADFVTAADPTNCRGETLKLRFDPFYIEDPDGIASDISFTVFSNWTAIGQHTHDVEDTATTESAAALTPTVVDSFDGSSFYPEVDIEVNGTTVATGVGSSTGSWSETLDAALLDTFDPGQNTIRAVPVNGTRGEVQLALSTEYIRTGDSK